MKRSYNKRSVSKTNSKTHNLSKEDVQKMIKQQVKSSLISTKELKWDTYINSWSASTTPIVQRLNAPSQGDAYNSRDGDEFQYVNIYGNLQYDKADPIQQIRFTVIQWFPDTSLDSPTATIVYSDITRPWLSPFNPDPKLRIKYKVLYDDLININDDVSVIRRKMYLPMKSFRRTVCTPGSTITGRNYVYMIISSDSSAATHPAVTFDGIYKWID